MEIPKRFPAILAQASGVILLVTSILCLAFKTTAFNSYMYQTSQGQGNSGVRVPGYGVHEFSQLYPDHLLDVNPKPIVAASSFGLILGLAMTVLAVWTFKTKKCLKVCVIELVKVYCRGLRIVLSN